MKVYVQAKSKKQINEWIQSGTEIEAVEYSMQNHMNGGDYETYHNLVDTPDGTVVAVFDKYVGGNPYSKAWGAWDKTKGVLK